MTKKKASVKRIKMLLRQENGFKQHDSSMSKRHLRRRLKSGVRTLEDGNCLFTVTLKTKLMREFRTQSVEDIHHCCRHFVNLTRFWALTFVRVAPCASERLALESETNKYRLLKGGKNLCAVTSSLQRAHPSHLQFDRIRLFDRTCGIHL
jgi:hypothetical protein